MPQGEPLAEALTPGDIVWEQPEIAPGREQAGRRPALVVAGLGYLEKTISRERIVGRAGRVNDATLAAVRTWLADFLDL